MSAFEEFIQRELPKRPFSDLDGSPGDILVREGPGPRQVVFKPLADVGLGGSAASLQSVVVSQQWQAVDALPVDRSGSYLWKVQVEEPVALFRNMQLIAAVHDGFVGSPATDVKYTVSNKMVVGTGNARVRVVLSVVAGVSLVQLEVQANTGAEVSVWRIQELG